MKKAVLIFTLVLGVSLFSQAQINPHALGLRFGGDGSTNGAELSYQHGMGDANRLEFDLGFRGYKHYRNMFISGVYQWDWNIKGGWNWYIGPGAILGFYNWDDKITSSRGLNIGLGGQIGIEYDFNKSGAPIIVSLDTRPMFDFIGYNNGFGWGAALGIRYTW
ncbi:MAG TPA: hypothetical protein P5228_02175 [Bacteroidales bacterium]|nr:hypothetical protein [Bacteroidales bacterium]HRZ49133.1 hypothetical protein [Bacteroidales bacterium]